MEQFAIFQVSVTESRRDKWAKRDYLANKFRPTRKKSLFCFIVLFTKSRLDLEPQTVKCDARKKISGISRTNVLWIIFFIKFMDCKIIKQHFLWVSQSYISNKQKKSLLIHSINFNGVKNCDKQEFSPSTWLSWSTCWCFMQKLLEDGIEGGEGKFNCCALIDAWIASSASLSKSSDVITFPFSN